VRIGATHPALGYAIQNSQKVLEGIWRGLHDHLRHGCIASRRIWRVNPSYTGRRLRGTAVPEYVRTSVNEREEAWPSCNPWPLLMIKGALFYQPSLGVSLWVSSGWKAGGHTSRVSICGYHAWSRWLAYCSHIAKYQHPTTRYWRGPLHARHSGTYSTWLMGHLPSLFFHVTGLLEPPTDQAKHLLEFHSILTSVYLEIFPVCSILTVFCFAYGTRPTRSASISKSSLYSSFWLSFYFHLWLSECFYFYLLIVTKYRWHWKSLS